MSRTVFITGLGAIASTGSTLNHIWCAVKEGRSAIEPIDQWDTSSWEAKLGAQIKPYKPKVLFPEKKTLKMLSRQDVVGLNAAIQAIEDSGLISYRNTLDNQANFNEKTGIFVGAPGNKFTPNYEFLPPLAQSKGNLKMFGELMSQHVHPMWLLKILPNNVLAYTGMHYGFKGANQNITNHAVSGSQAIIEAYEYIREGLIDRAVVVAYDLGPEAHDLMLYQRIGLLSKHGIFPFSAKRDGTVFGEAAAAFILESSDSVNLRNATCYGEILGGATTSEAQGVLPHQKAGEGLEQAIKKALLKAAIQPEEVGVIVAHGNGTRLSDQSESLAIAKSFKNHAVPVTAFKWSFGHTCAAAGVLESALMLNALREERAPGIPHIDWQQSDCEMINAQPSAQPLQSKIGLLINRAFGSLSTCLLIRAL